MVVEVFEQCWTCCSKNMFVLPCAGSYSNVLSKMFIFSQKQREIDQGQSVHRRFFQVSAKQKESVSRLALARHRETARINFLAAAEGAPLGTTHVVELKTELTHAREDRAN